MNAAAATGGSVLLPPETLRSAQLLYATAGAPAHTYPGGIWELAMGSACQPGPRGSPPSCTNHT